MYCKFCGNEIPDDSLFCSSCGSEIQQESYSEVTAAVQTNTAPPKSRKGVIAFLLTLSIVLGCGCTYLYWERTNNLSQISELNVMVSKLEKDITKLEKNVTKYESKAKILEKITSYYYSSANKGYALDNFKADTEIVFVKQGGTASFTLTAYSSGGTSVTATLDDRSIASVDFGSDSWSTSVKMTVKGKKQGATICTFSNSSGKSTFQVLIVVT